MKFTIGWLREHLDTQKKDNELIEKLTDIGLEVESFENQSSGLDSFKVAKIINAEQHPNADRLRICDVDIGLDDTVKVVCGAPNAKKDLLTIYAGPGSIIPKNNIESSMLEDAAIAFCKPLLKKLILKRVRLPPPADQKTVHPLP